MMCFHGCWEMAQEHGNLTSNPEMRGDVKCTILTPDSGAAEQGSEKRPFISMVLLDLLNIPALLRSVLNEWQLMNTSSEHGAT